MTRCYMGDLQMSSRMRSRHSMFLWLAVIACGCVNPRSKPLEQDALTSDEPDLRPPSLQDTGLSKGLQSDAPTGSQSDAPIDLAVSLSSDAGASGESDAGVC